MGVYDAPQWLLSAWVGSCRAAGATASPDEIRAVGQRLIERWSEPDRHFHNIKHLVHVLTRVDELAQETHEPDLVRLAAWYHGAIFDAAAKAAYANRGGEDEVASAELARSELTALGVPSKSVDRVVQLVTALVRHTVSPGDFDCAVLCDADMAMLAAEPQRYKSYLKDVRAEYAHVPVEDYLRARAAILTKLQQRPSLFASPLGAAWEEPARQNVAAELHRIRKELAALETAASDGTAGAAASGGEAASTSGASGAAHLAGPAGPAGPGGTADPAGADGTAGSRGTAATGPVRTVSSAGNVERSGRGPAAGGTHRTLPTFGRR